VIKHHVTHSRTTFTAFNSPARLVELGTAVCLPSYNSMPVVKSCRRTVLTTVRITSTLSQPVRFCGTAVKLSSKGKIHVGSSFHEESERRTVI
jgi:hypothetical protein